MSLQNEFTVTSMPNLTPVPAPRVEVPPPPPLIDQPPCSPRRHPFDRFKHQPVYHVGVHSVHSYEATFQEYNVTFSEYLTATAGQRFDPPIRFDMVPYSFDDFFDAIDNEELDFMFTSPSVYSCVGIEVGASALGTIITHEEIRDKIFDLDVFAGVMLTRADNHEIETVQDLKDKIIGAGDISQLMGGQLQFYEMEKQGLSFVNDPKQVVFVHDQEEVVRGVLRGDFDVGFVRTDQIERTRDEHGRLLDPELFKVLSPKIHITENGDYFPFLHTTDVFPEWPVAMLSHIPQDIAEEVEKALRALHKHAQVGRNYNDCITNSTGNPAICEQMGFPYDFLPDARCDTTKDLAKIAKQATKDGHFYGFRPARSYFQLRSMLEDGGFLTLDENDEWHCTRPSNLYDGLNCPVGYFKRSREEFAKGCDMIDLPCQEGHECFCKPCVKSHEVDVYEYIEGAEDKHLQDYFGEERLGCEKMEVCAHAQQTKTVHMRLFDNKHRIDPVVEVLVHSGDFSRVIPVTKIPGHSAYEFDLMERKIRAQVLEIFFNGEQIPESPIRIIVDALDCDAETQHDSHRTADSNGNCVCSDNTYEMLGACIESTYFFLIVFSGVLLAMFIFVFFYLRYKKNQNDSMWHVDVDELQFAEPPEVIGQGGFGVVILGDYRGTKVAVKRVLPPTEMRRGSSKRGSVKMPSSVMESTSAKRAIMVGSGGDEDVNVVKDSLSSDVEAQTAPTKSIKSSSVSWEASFFNGKNLRSNPLKMLASATLSVGDSNSLKMRRTSIAESSVFFVNRVLPEFLRFDEHTKQKREFVAEMRLLSRLRHPCITTVMGAVVSGSSDPMLVMEYMEYGSLSDVLSNDTVITGGEILLQIIRDIVQGLQFLHASKPPILHGDLKGKNILVDSRFRAKVADFGFSHIKQQTNKSVLKGTPFYMAPEYLRRQTEYTEKCDIYSLSMIVYEIYARHEPFEGQDPRKLLPQICHPRANKRPKVAEACPPRIEEMMKKCWASNPFFRPSAKDLDYLLTDLSARDAEPLNKNQNTFKDGMKRKPTSLYDVFPKHIADALNAGKKIEAESHEIVTIFFCDIVGFTNISQTFSPLKVSNMLDRLYLAFDELAGKHKIFKVETIGDAYMGVTNLEGDQLDDHVKQIAEFAVEAIEAASQVLIDDEAPERGVVQIRVGFHSGPVVSNVIGSLNPRYGLFGDTVNTASRMETNSEAGKILCSHASAEILKVQAPSLAIKLRGKIKVKGKGQMMTYWVGNTGYSSKPNLVPILDVSESGSASEITMEASNTLHVGALNTRSVDDHSFGTKETDDWLSIGDSDRYQVQANLDSKKNVHLAKISGALIESLRELVASRGENNTVSRHEKEYIKRLENEIGGEGTVLGEMVDCIPFYKSKITHLDPFDVELSKLVEQQVRDFVEACAGLYSSEHKFHGIFHALHVCSSAKAMLSRIDCGDDPSSDRSYGIADDKLAQFTVMFSALIHDLDHRGVPNFCLSEEDPELRTRYRGKAIAEQNSVDLGWELLMAPKYADLRACIYTSGEEMIRFRKVLVNIVIATDIFDPDLSKRRDDRWKRAFDPEHWTRSFGSAKAEDDSLKATVILELLMQASDIAHTMQHWHVYKTWNQKLFEEMYAAYVAGRFPKDPSENWYKGEIDFFDKKVIPLAKELKDTEVFGDFSDEYLQFATENREHWEAEGNTLVQNMVKKVKMGGKKAGLKI